MSNVPYTFLNKLRFKNDLIKDFFAEFWGTFILMLIGNAAFAQTVLTGNGVNDVLAVVFAWALAVMLGITASGGITGGHVNPVVSFALATMGKLPWRKLPVFLVAQNLGSFFAACILYAEYHEMLNAFDEGNRTVLGPTGTGFIFTTYPRDTISLATVFIDGLVTCGLLMFTAAAIIDGRNTALPKWMHPYSIGLMICVLALCFGPNNMAPLNPARDFPGRVFTAMAGWGGATFSPMGYHYWWVGGIVAPLVGGVVGGWLYLLCIELHWPDPVPAQEHELKELIDGKKNRAAC